jgi:predicted acetyltransferase
LDNKLKLEIPNLKHKNKAIEYINEFIKYDSNPNGSGGLHRFIDNYEGWLEKIKDDLDYNNIKEDKVPANTYFAIRMTDNKIIGMINIRHRLNEYLTKKGGHIGYSVRPTERKKGYATEILYLGLQCCKKLSIKNVLITCDKGNVASAKTILKNNGVLENEIMDKELSEEIIQRYWIKNE